MRLLAATLMALLLTAWPVGAQGQDAPLPEEMLASLELNQDVTADDPLVFEFAERLDTLEMHCAEDRATLAGLVASVNRELASHDVQHSVRYAAAGLEAASEDLPPQSNCTDLATSYASTVLNSVG